MKTKFYHRERNFTMKKTINIRTIAGALMLLVMSLMLSGCEEWLLYSSSDNNDDQGPIFSKPRGNFDWLGTEVGMGDLSNEPISVDMPSEFNRKVMSLNSDGSYQRITRNDQGQVLYEENGTWSEEDGQLRITVGEFSTIFDCEQESTSIYQLIHSGQDGSEQYWTRERWQTN